MKLQALLNILPTKKKEKNCLKTATAGNTCSQRDLVKMSETLWRARTSTLLQCTKRCSHNSLQWTLQALPKALCNSANFSSFPASCPLEIQTQSFSTWKNKIYKDVQSKRLPGNLKCTREETAQAE